MSKNRHGAARAEAAIAAAKPAKPLESGLGEMSPEDKAAIMGITPQEMAGAGPILDPTTAPETAPMAISETVTLAADATIEPPVLPPTQTPPALVELGARLATIEARMGRLETAMEKWAALMNDRPAMMQHLAVHSPIAVRPATIEEEAAYCRQNFERSGRGEVPFDGIQAWRDADSPGLAR